MVGWPVGRHRGRGRSRGAARGRGVAAAGDAGRPAGVHGALARRHGGARPGARPGPCIRRHTPRRAWPPPGVARLPRRAAAAALSGDEILAMMQGPDIGKAIFEHTSDSHVVELPFGLGEWHLPTGWRLVGVDVSPTKHGVFMIVAALLVFLTIWYA